MGLEFVGTLGTRNRIWESSELICKSVNLKVLECCMLFIGEI